ncbi:MAG: restriction endonuclease [Butyrivibrio sp.]|jgi:restriction system protein|nr:restriction endonuclease [Butyrivibrio sp.]
MAGMKIYIVIAALCLVAAVLILILIRLRRSRPLPMDELEGHEFEYYCADLLRAHGFVDVEVTRGSGDFGTDILAEKDGVTYAVQCKCYDKPIGVKAVQEAYAGRDFYDRMVGAVMTNQYFTAPAVDAARKLKILMWDRGYLDSMIEEERQVQAKAGMRK